MTASEAGVAASPRQTRMPATTTTASARIAIPRRRFGGEAGLTFGRRFFHFPKR